MTKDQFLSYVKGLKIVFHTIRPEINLNIKDGKPTVYKDIIHDISEFSDFLSRYILFKIRKNRIVVSGLLNFLSNPVNYEFYDMDPNSIFVNFPIQNATNAFKIF